jgi:hypothetical protein
MVIIPQFRLECQKLCEIGLKLPSLRRGGAFFLGWVSEYSLTPGHRFQGLSPPYTVLYTRGPWIAGHDPGKVIHSLSTGKVIHNSCTGLCTAYPQAGYPQLGHFPGKVIHILSTANPQETDRISTARPVG